MTLQFLIDAINEEPDLSKRIDDFLYCSARQSDKAQYANAFTLLDAALTILKDNRTLVSDYFVSQVAFEFTRMGQMQRAGVAINHLSDAVDTISNVSIRDEALRRMAIERCKVSLLDAQNIVNAMTDVSYKNETIKMIATYAAEHNSLNAGRTVAQAITDPVQQYQADRQAIREYSKGL